LRTIVDPFSYRGKLLQPKLILLGTNDRYWPLDALNLYWGELGGEKHVLYVPNNGHGLNDFPRILGGVVALHREAAGDGKMAEMNWKHIDSSQGTALEMRCDIEPQKATLWTASSPTRDFRDAKWTNGPIECKDGAYCTLQSAPETGYRAFFCEAVFDSQGLPYYLSTNLRILGAKDAPEASGEKKEAATGQ
jgi:PhoPQ-activated pathogenicity-related protein